MTHTLMNQKRIRACERIETLAGEPIVGQRCKLRLWNGGQYTDIHTSAVTDWWCGYPYAIDEAQRDLLFQWADSIGPLAELHGFERVTGEGLTPERLRFLADIARTCVR